jgi:hypothetical protein
MLERLDIRRRARAAGFHMLICAVAAALAAAVVFGLWYPGVYRSASGGRELFLLVVSVDVVLGPLLTFAVFDLKKGWKHLRRDLSVIGLIQFAALVYGLHTVYVVRPIAMAFEVDRFRIVTATDVYRSELPKARPEYRTLPLTGPWLLGTRDVQAGEERKDAIFMGLKGVDVADRPLFWQSYAGSMAAAVAKARPVSALLTRYPERASEFRGALMEMRAVETRDLFLPLVARTDWVVVLGTDGAVLGYLQVNGFF